MTRGRRPRLGSATRMLCMSHEATTWGLLALAATVDVSDQLCPRHSFVALSDIDNLKFLKYFFFSL